MKSIIRADFFRKKIKKFKKGLESQRWSVYNKVIVKDSQSQT